MQRVAIRRGGQCLSTEYHNCGTLMEWECSEGHFFSMPYDNIRRGSWCPQCPDNSPLSTPTLRLSELRGIALDRGGKILSKHYAHSHEKVEVECAEGHQWEVTPANLKQGKWCPRCAGVVLTLEDMHDEAEKRGGRCLSREYVNSQTPLLWECKEGHQWETVPNSVRQGSWCPYCAGVRSVKKDITEAELRYLYLDELKTEKEIATMYDTYQVKISRLRKKWGIPTLGKTGRLEQLRACEDYEGSCIQGAYSLSELCTVLDDMVADVKTGKGRSFSASLRLTKEAAQDLYDRGMGQKEIANVFGVSRQTVARRLKGHTKSKIDLDVPTYPSMDAYDPKAYKDLPEEIQKQWVDEIFALLKGTPFPYPQKVAAPLNDYYQLRDKNVYVKDSKIVPKTLYGIRLCDGYFPNRFHARYKDQMSVVDGWGDDTYLRKAIEMQLKTGDPLVPRRICKGIQYMVRTPTIFRPGVAKCLYQTYAKYGDTVWDPCMGYGGRLLGAIVAGVNYVGTDVEPLTVKGNLDLASDILASDKVHLFCSPAEDFNPLDHVDKVDMVFTSPPYFDREKYSDKDTQSWKGYSNLEAWVLGFLRPVIQTSYDVLPSGGILALNICDIQDKGNVTPLEKITCDVARDVGFELKEVLQMPLSNLSPRDFEPVFVFKR